MRGCSSRGPGARVSRPALGAITLGRYQRLSLLDRRNRHDRRLSAQRAFERRLLPGSEGRLSLAREGIRLRAAVMRASPTPMGIWPTRRCVHGNFASLWSAVSGAPSTRARSRSTARTRRPFTCISTKARTSTPTARGPGGGRRNHSRNRRRSFTATAPTARGIPRGTSGPSASPFWKMTSDEWDKASGLITKKRLD